MSKTDDKTPARSSDSDDVTAIAMALFSMNTATLYAILNLEAAARGKPPIFEYSEVHKAWDDANQQIKAVLNRRIEGLALNG